MSWDSTPWFVEGGAQVSANMARLLAYMATGGSEGVLRPTDLAVFALAVPGSSVRVEPGACAILNRASGISLETYLGRVLAEDIVPIQPTTSSGARSDFVVARVENPFLSGEPWSTPPNPATGQYIYSRIIQGVPVTATKMSDLALSQQQSAIPLARIDIPPSTGTITQAMITDLRTVTNPVTGGVAGPPVGGGTGGGGAQESQWVQTAACVAGSTLHHTDLSYVQWPAEASWPAVPIPSWATTVDALLIFNPKLISGNAGGTLKLQIGSAQITSTFDVDTVPVTQRSTLTLSGSALIPTAMRGAPALVQLFGEQIASATGGLTCPAGTNLSITLTFRARPSLT